MKVVELNVTQNDIDKGQPRMAGLCAVARAGSRHFDKTYMVTCDGVWVHVYNEGTGRFVGKLSKSDQDWVSDYDYGKQVQPRRMTVFLLEKNFADDSIEEN